MKLQEALIKRKSLLVKAEALQQRMARNISRPGKKIQDSVSMMEELVGLLTDHANLSVMIVYTNTHNDLVEGDDSITLAEAVSKLDVCRKHLRVYSNLRDDIYGLGYNDREVMSDVDVDVLELNNIIDEFGDMLQKLDSQIQQRNWQLDVPFKK